jgi:hypothetical protein
MSKLDKDNNGCLSQDEFVDGCLNDPDLQTLLTPSAKSLH